MEYSATFIDTFRNFGSIQMKNKEEMDTAILTLDPSFHEKNYDAHY